LAAVSAERDVRKWVSETICLCNDGVAVYRGCALYYMCVVQWWKWQEYGSKVYVEELGKRAAGWRFYSSSDSTVHESITPADSISKVGGSGSMVLPTTRYQSVMMQERDAEKEGCCPSPDMYVHKSDPPVPLRARKLIRPRSARQSLNPLLH
jgi:hypothetical protein